MYDERVTTGNVVALIYLFNAYFFKTTTTTTTEEVKNGGQQWRLDILEDFGQKLDAAPLVLPNSIEKQSTIQNEYILRITNEYSPVDELRQILHRFHPARG